MIIKRKLMARETNLKKNIRSNALSSLKLMIAASKDAGMSTDQESYFINH